MNKRKHLTQSKIVKFPSILKHLAINQQWKFVYASRSRLQNGATHSKLLFSSVLKSEKKFEKRITEYSDSNSVNDTRV